MKKYKVIILNEAKKDVRDARNWYNDQQKGLGKRFTSDLKNTLLSIAANPTSYAVRYSLNRKANLKTFPYGVFFTISSYNDTVYIISVMHDARNTDEVLPI